MLNKKDYEKFNLDTPKIEERELGFKRGSFKLVEELFDIDGHDLMNEYHSHYFREKNISATNLEKQFLINDYDGYVELFMETANESFSAYLSLIEMLVEILLNIEIRTSTDAKCKIIGGKIVKLLEDSNIGYKWNSKNHCLYRIMSKVDRSLTSVNYKSIKKNGGEENAKLYDDCIKDFLSLKSNTNSTTRYESLVKIKEVYEKFLGTMFKKVGGDPMYISNYDMILSRLFKGSKEKNKEQYNTLLFIGTNIHHSKQSDDGKIERRKFSEGEYIYWWLEINKLIYLISISK